MGIAILSPVLQELCQAWNETSDNMYERVKRVSTIIYREGIGINQASDVLPCSVAEVSALLELSALDDSKIRRVAEASPPISTWLLFALANEEAFDEGLKALTAVDKEPFITVYDAMKKVQGPSMKDRMLLLKKEHIQHIAEKGLQYRVINENNRSFLRSMSHSIPNKKATPKQISYYVGLVTKIQNAKLLDKGALDKDEEICSEIKEILGKE